MRVSSQSMIIGLRLLAALGLAVLPTNWAWAQSPSIEIAGVVTAPPGHDVRDVMVAQCLDNCSWKSITPIEGSGRVGLFHISGNPDNRYQILFFKDVGPQGPSSGDLYGQVVGPVRTGTKDINVRLYEHSQAEAALDAELRGETPAWPDGTTAPPPRAEPLHGTFKAVERVDENGRRSVATTRSAALANAWQNSSGIHNGSGLGATVTNLESRYGVTNGIRAIQISLESDGTFQWILSSDLNKDGCRIRIYEEKSGVFLVMEDSLVFQARDGSSIYNDDCMSGPSTNPIDAETEKFHYSRSGSGFRLTGGLDSVTWDFRPAG